MEIEKLKQKILDLAIRGKLVPQDPNDEPASVLIDRIRAEKEELIKQGKIKRSKEDSYIYKGSDNCYYEKVGNKTTCINEEIPFEIPDNWTWCRVGIISNYGSNTIVNDVDIKEDAWVLELEDIEGYTSTLLTHRIKGNRKFGSSKYKFNAGDLLFSKLRVYLKKVIIADMPGFCSSEILALNFMPYCLNEYAAIFFISSYLLNKVAQIEYGCKMPRLGTNDGKKLLFPLPPMQEQIRIVKQYKTLNFHIDKLRHSKQLLDKYIDEIKIKILDDIFGENSRYKSYYTQTQEKLENIASLITKGSTPTSYGFQYVDKGISFVKVENVHDYYIDHTTIRQFITVDAHEFQKRSQLQENDMLFSIAGTIGRICLVKIEDLPANTNQAFAIIRGYDKILIPSYLKWYLTWYLNDKSKLSGHGGGMLNITLNDLKKLEVFFPVNKNDQQILVDRIEKLMEVLSSIS